jgi:hypothetical protein
MRPYLENTQHKKRLVEWLKLYSACLASAKPWVKPQHQKKKKKKRKKINCISIHSAKAYIKSQNFHKQKFYLKDNFQ